MNSAQTPITIANHSADSEVAAGLQERLSRELGPTHIVRATGTIGGSKHLPGIRHHERGVLLVIMGPLWAHAKDISGQRSLDDPRDPVRVQIERALRANLPLLPVLVSGAQLPSAADLPVSLRPLLLKQPIYLTSGHFDEDVGRLIDRLGQELGQSPGPTGHLRTGESRDSTELISLDYALRRQAQADDTGIWPMDVASPQETASRPRETPAPDTAEPAPVGSALADTALAESPQVPPPSDESPLAGHPVESSMSSAALEREISPSPTSSPQDSGLPPAEEPQILIYAGAIPGESFPEERAQEKTQREEAGISRRKMTSLRAVLVAAFGVSAVTVTTVVLTHQSQSSITTKIHNSPKQHHQTAACAPSRTPSTLTPTQVVEQLYVDINGRNFCAAWSLGADSIRPGESFRAYVAGFRSLGHDVLTINSISGNNPTSVYVTLQVFNKHAQPMMFTGYYTVESGKVTSGHLH